MGFVRLGLEITNKTMGMELGFKPKICQEMGFRQDLGWEMVFTPPSPPLPEVAPFTGNL